MRKSQNNIDKIIEASIIKTFQWNLEDEENQQPQPQQIFPMEENQSIPEQPALPDITPDDLYDLTEDNIQQEEITPETPVDAEDIPEDDSPVQMPIQEELEQVDQEVDQPYFELAEPSDEIEDVEEEPINPDEVNVDNEIPEFPSQFQAADWAKENTHMMGIDYITKDGTHISRIIEPHGIYKADTGNTLVVTYDNTVGDIRAFILRNIEDYEILDRTFNKKFNFLPK